MKIRYFDDVAVGDLLTPLEKRPDEVALFRFSAVTWNAHKIHYDARYAAEEGYPGVLVQAHLHGSYLSQAVLDWGGAMARLHRFRFENRAFAIPGDVLTISGRVTGATSDVTCGLVECEVEARKSDGTLCAPAWVSVQLPRRDGDREPR